MKKLNGFLIVLSILLGTLFMASCDTAPELDPFASTYDQWYVYYKTVNAPIANKDAEDTSKDGILKDAKIYVKYNKTTGLDLMVVTTKAQEIGYFGGAYTVKADITTGATKNYKPEEFEPTKWKALMLLGRFTVEEPPKITVDISQMLEGQFNMKRLLAEWLLSMC